MRRRLARGGLGLLLAGLLSLTLPSSGRAAPRATAQGAGDNVGKEASRHFQRAVDLYNEGDFRGALVEFRKAYRLLPRASVLYNIGQTEYQVQEYAQALRTLERFLSETSPNAPHRAEVEESVAVLRTRVGWIALVSDAAGCDVTVDDVAAGTTPLAAALLVSVGRRKVAVSCARHPRASREVEVASGETVRVAIDTGAAAPPPADPAAATASASAEAGARDDIGTGRRGLRLSWTVTGVLALGTAGLYTGAILGSQQIANLRASYPVTADRLASRARLNRRLALAGDILAVATVAAAGLSSYLQLSAPRERDMRVGLTGTGVALQGRF